MYNRNKLSQFWQELKRRNVIRVISVYAGAAFGTNGWLKLKNNLYFWVLKSRIIQIVKLLNACVFRTITKFREIVQE